MRASLLIGVCVAALAAPAFAADLPVKALPPVAPPVPYFSWTGFYIGANIGGAWSNGSITDNLTGASLGSSTDGFIGGGQLGFNYQFNTFVLGVEWDIDGTTLSKTSAAVPTGLGTLQAHVGTDWISTLTARGGFAFDRWLIYAKGGGAWVQNSATFSNLTTGGSASFSNTNSGWTVGVGGEWAFAPQWSAKLEYDYVKLDSWSPSTGTVIAGDTLTLSRNIQMLKAGVNYRFDWGHY
jgi:outer membrane immunogenic protein